MTTVTVDRALLEQAYEQGWIEAATWANQNELVDDIDSPDYIRDRDSRLAALAQPQQYQVLAFSSTEEQAAELQAKGFEPYEGSPEVTVGWASTMKLQPVEDQPQQGPVAWLDEARGIFYQHCTHETDRYHGFPLTTPLYKHPPRREWVSLTDEEMKAALLSVDPETKRLPPGFRDFARAVETKLKEKNT